MKEKEKLLNFSNKHLKVELLESTTGVISIIVKRKRGRILFQTSPTTEDELISDTRSARQIIGKYSIVAERVFTRVVYKTFGEHVIK